MPDTKQHLEELVRFIHEHRSNESNFKKLYEKLVEAEGVAQNNGSQTYAGTLREIKETYAAVYNQKREKGIGAWPEFENFVSHFEKAVTEALREYE